MPFTPSHAVVAIPFARTPLPAGVVAVGAMAPDLPLFFRWGPDYETTHGWPSLAWTSLPIALGLYLVWRLLVRPAASALLPPALGERIPIAWDAPAPDVLRGWRARGSARLVLAAALAGVAALLGVLTHVVWDGFTHPGRFGSAWFPVLGAEWGPLPGTSWLQYASSTLGLVGVLLWLLLAARRAPRVPRADPPGVRVVRRVAWVLSVLALVSLGAAGLVLLGVPDDFRSFTGWAFAAGTRAGLVILVILAVAAVIVPILRVRLAGRGTPAGPPGPETASPS